MSGFTRQPPPYLWLLAGGLMLCAGLSWSAWRRRGMQGAGALAAMLLGTAAWSSGYLLELQATTFEAKLLWAKAEYLGIALVPLAWLVFAIQLTGRQGWLKDRRKLLLGLVPLVTLILVWTNGTHGPVWSDVQLRSGDGFAPLSLSYGPWFWVHLFSSYGMLLCGSVLLVSTVVHSPQMYRAQVVAVLVAVVAPWVGNLLYLSGRSPIIDLTPFGFTISGLALAWGLFRQKLLTLFLGIVPVARKAIFEGMADAAIVVDRSNRIADLNPAARRIVGSSTEQLLGRSADVLADRHPGLAVLCRPDSGDTHVEVTVGDGREKRYFDLLVSSLRDELGISQGRLAVLRDITTRRQAEEALERQALYDSLTGLPNRNMLNRRLERAVNAGAGDRHPRALLLMDLDRFKEVNDTFGHHTGDLLLQQVGERLHGALREGDLIARLGGDEFAVLLENANRQHARTVTSRLLRSLEKPFTVRSYQLHVTVSIGIALYPEHAKDANTLMQRADVAMYLAKRARSGYMVYSAEADPYSPERLALSGELRSAIDRDELALDYQPQVEIRSGRVVKAEALVRWHHPRLGLVPPSRFVSLAEHTGLIKPLSLWVLRNSLRQCRDWRRKGLQLPVAVNLSPQNIGDQEILDGIAHLLRRSDLDRTSLEVEITESSLLEDRKSSLQFLAELSAMGVGIALDDFGTGFSSLANLARLPLTSIKIDQSFVHGLKKGGHDAAIVDLTVKLGHKLDLAVVAEGVEDRDTWNLLAEMDCDIGQGYYLSRPLSGSRIVRWVARAPQSFVAWRVRRA